jgi:hypothetical protein
VIPMRGRFLPILLVFHAGFVLADTYTFPFVENPNLTTLIDTRSGVSVRVNAVDKFWRSSGLRVEEGNTYLITAQGQWQIGGTCNPTGPGGISPYTVACWDVGPKTVSNGTHATLIGKVGHGGPPFAVGDAREFTAHDSGVLYFMVNDHPDWFFDNTGSAEARIRLLSSRPAGNPGAVTGRENPPVNTPRPAPRSGGGGGGRPSR